MLTSHFPHGNLIQKIEFCPEKWEMGDQWGFSRLKVYPLVSERVWWWRNTSPQKKVEREGRGQKSDGNETKRTQTNARLRPLSTAYNQSSTIIHFDASCRYASLMSSCVSYGMLGKICYLWWEVMAEVCFRLCSHYLRLYCPHANRERRVSVASI